MKHMLSKLWLHYEIAASASLSVGTRRAAIPAATVPDNARQPMSARGLLVMCLLCLCVIAGCDSSQTSNSDRDEADDTDVARTETERGPLKVVVELEPKSARLSDEPTLTITLDYEAGITLRKPPFGAAIGDFVIRDFHEPLPQVQENREIVRQVYTLEPMRTGALTIAPISVTFSDTRTNGDGLEHTLTTDPLSIDVTTMLDSETPSLADLKPAAGPVELPAPAWFLSPWVWVIAGVLLVMGTLMAWRRMRKPIVVEPVISPQERAARELERLLESNLAEQDIKLFYVELTAIVRRYIEGTTGIHAPEQTTEEFLREIAGHAAFSSGAGERLKDFLESADLVKFAAYQPGEGAVDESFRRARVFIGLEREEVAA